MKFLRQISWSATSTFSAVGASLIFNKLFSIFSGPAGLALLSHLQNLLSICLTVSQEGINRGVVKHLSGVKSNDPSFRSYFTATLLLQLASFVLLIPFVYFLLSAAGHLPAFLHSSKFLLLALSGVFLQILISFLLSFLLTQQAVVYYALINVFNNVATILLVYLGLINDLYFASCAIFLAPSLILPVLLYRLRNIITIKNLSFSSVRPFHFSNILGFVAIALSVLVFGRMVDYFVRVFIIEAYDLHATGLWQAAVKASDGYTTIFSGIINILFFPGLAQRINQQENIKRYFRESFLKFIPVTYFGLALVFVFKDFILELLFDASFKEGKPFFSLQIIGDFLKFPAWLIVYIILAEGRTRLYIYTQFFSAFIYILLLIFCTRQFGLIGVGYAHIGRFFIYFMVVAFLYRRKI